MSISDELKEILHDIAEGLSRLKDRITGNEKVEDSLDRIEEALEEKGECILGGLTDRLIDKIKKL